MAHGTFPQSLERELACGSVVSQGRADDMPEHTSHLQRLKEWNVVSRLCPLTRELIKLPLRDASVAMVCRIAPMIAIAALLRRRTNHNLAATGSFAKNNIEQRAFGLE